MWGALSAMIGIIISWGIYIMGEVIRNSTNLLFDELGILITGSSGFGGWLIIIVLIVGAIIGCGRSNAGFASAERRVR